MIERRTREEFVEFCEAYQTANYHDFDESEIEEVENELVFVATHVAEGNYKTPLEIHFRPDTGEIDWRVIGSDLDAGDEAAELYHDMFIA